MRPFEFEALGGPRTWYLFDSANRLEDAPMYTEFRVEADHGLAISGVRRKRELVKPGKLPARLADGDVPALHGPSFRLACLQPWIGGHLFAHDIAYPATYKFQGPDLGTMRSTEDSRAIADGDDDPRPILALHFSYALTAEAFDVELRGVAGPVLLRGSRAAHAPAAKRLPVQFEIAFSIPVAAVNGFFALDERDNRFPNRLQLVQRDATPS